MIDLDTALSELAMALPPTRTWPSGPASPWTPRVAVCVRWATIEELPGALVDLAGRPGPDGSPRPKLLGGFDPLLHGWVDREPVLGSNKSIVTRNGIFRPFALVGGRAVATWGIPRGKVTLEPFAGIDAWSRAELESEARDVERFLMDHKPAVRES